MRHLLLTIAALVTLAGCGAVTEPYGLKDPFGVPKPFEGMERNSGLTGRIAEIPAFYVGGIDGLEGDPEDALREKVAGALRGRDIAAATKMPSAGAWLLIGSVVTRPMPPPSSVTPPPAPAPAHPKPQRRTKANLDLVPKPAAPAGPQDIVWTVQDGSGKERTRFATPYTGDEVAELAASRLASVLGAELVATVEASAAAPPLDPASGPAAAPVAPHAAVLEIKGAPGDGETVLSRAIALMLANTGMKVTALDDPKAWRVACSVQVKNMGAKDEVVLEWRVMDAKGLVLGTLAQKNQVPAKTLAKTWGETGALAAAAAAPGLAQIVAKAHNAGLDPQDAAKSADSSPPVAGKP
jgi:hypothetical protein